MNRREFISGVAAALLAAPTAPARLSGILCCHTTKVSQRAGIQCRCRHRELVDFDVSLRKAVDVPQSPSGGMGCG